VGLFDTVREAAGAASTAALDVLSKAQDEGDDGAQPTTDTPATAGPHPSEIGDPVSDPKALFWDPFSVIDALGYKERPSSISYSTLSAMVFRMPIIQAIIKTRTDQMANFSLPQEDKFQTGFRIQLRDRKASPSKASEKKSKEITNWVMTTGKVNDRGTPNARDNFETFLRKIVRDALTYDQLGFEVREDRGDKPYDFYAVDGATLRIADTTKLYYQGTPEETRYVQIYDGLVTAEYGADQMCFGVRNPVTDIRNQGYGIAETEMLISTVTSLLWSWDYNQKFFCADGDGLVTTSEGLIPLRDLSGKNFVASTGPGTWGEARAFPTGKKVTAVTTLWNGLELTTSPDHRYRVIPASSRDGDPEWVRQEDLQAGDFALVSYERSDPEFDYETLLVDRVYDTDRKTGRDFRPTKALIEDPEFWEFMGFALGDGYFPDEGRDTPSWLQVFPHYSRDADLFERFKAVCVRHGIHCTDRVINKTIERSDGEFGYPALQICHTAFHRWLRDIGFRPSREGKRIPESVYRQPAHIRAALLRGIFSADGCTATHATGYRTPSVHSSDPALAQDILKCLWSVGVASNLVGGGTAASRHGTITVQDIASFTSSVGYLQAYKNEGIERSPAQRDRWDRLHPHLSRNLGTHVWKHDNYKSLSVAERDMARKASGGRVTMSRAYAIHLLQRLGAEEPAWLRYLQVPVEVVGHADEDREMFDVEVFNDEHLFVLNHMAVHNSQGTSTKGIINFKGAVPEKQLRAFRRHWYSMVAGVENAFKTPITNAEELQYINLQQSNRDMEFSAWFDFLIKVACAIYGMDPMEINFKYGDSGGSGGSMFESSNKQKLAQSKDKGLQPLLRFIQHRLSSFLVHRIDEDFEFAFVGLDAQTPDELADLNTKQVTSYKMVDEVRAEEDLPPLPDGEGQVILHAVWMQNKTMAAQQEMGTGDFAEDDGTDAAFGGELDGIQNENAADAEDGAAATSDEEAKKGSSGGGNPFGKGSWSSQALGGQGTPAAVPGIVSIDLDL